MVAGDDVERNCVTSVFDGKGHSLVLVVKTDGESFFSSIYRIVDPKGPKRETVYEVSAWLTAMATTPAGALFAVDAKGFVHSNETGSFQVTNTQTSQGFNRVWCLDDEQIFACGPGGVMVRKTGPRWVSFNSGLDGDLYGLHGTSAQDIYTVGENGRIFHFDGRTWQRIEPPTNFLLNAVLCLSPEEVYICGLGASIFVGSQSKWRQIEAPPVEFHSLAHWRSAVYVAAGGDGVFVVEGKAVKLVKAGPVFYELTAAPDVLLAAGDDLAGFFDGTKWKGNRFS